MKLRTAHACRGWVAGLACVGMLGLGVTGFSGASYASSAKKVPVKEIPLFLDVDTVSVAKANDCYTMNNFAAGSSLLFRIKVFNGATGDVMTSAQLRSVDVTIPGGVTRTAKYASHKTDSFWTVLWTIPASNPAGVVNYTVTARANNGQVGHYVPFDVTTASLTVVAASRGVERRERVKGRQMKVRIAKAAGLGCCPRLHRDARLRGHGLQRRQFGVDRRRTRPLFVDVETATSSGQLANVFTAGTKVEFWIKVFNPSTGDVPLTSTALKSVIVGLPRVRDCADYGKHSTDAFWVASWAIPASYPAGMVPYTVTARAKNGAIGRYVPFNISASSLTVAG